MPLVVPSSSGLSPNKIRVVEVWEGKYLRCVTVKLYCVCMQMQFVSEVSNLEGFLNYVVLNLCFNSFSLILHPEIRADFVATM